MSYEPGAEMTPIAGREYGMKELMSIAWRQFKALLWPAIGYALLVGLMILGVFLGIAVVGGPLCWLAVTALEGSPVAMVIALIAIVVPCLLLWTALVYPLHQGYRWALIRSYDNRAFDWQFVLRGWKRPWRMPLGALGVLATLAGWLLVAPVFVVAMGTFASGGAAGLGRLAVAGVGLANGIWGQVAQGVVSLFVLLAGPIMLASERPRIIEALKTNWQILRNQPKRFIFLVATPVAVALLVILPNHLAQAAMGATGNPAMGFFGCFTSLLAIAQLFFALYWAFVVAAYYRSLFGMSLDSATLVPTRPDLVASAPTAGVVNLPQPPAPSAGQTEDQTGDTP